MTAIFHNTKGSVLIVVLWSLIMISYLVGDFLIHNQSKTGSAMNLMTSFRQQNAIESLIHLVALDEWTAGLTDYSPETWMNMTVAGIPLRFRLDTEEGRVNINSDGDETIRQTMKNLLEESEADRADMLTDMLLDWRDTNDLARVNGAEARHYMASGLGYLPADGPFKTLTEALMLSGMTPDTFWGDPGKPLSDEDEASYEINAFVEAFTIFDGSTQRLSILIPFQNQNTQLYVILFFTDPKNKNEIEQYTTIISG